MLHDILIGRATPIKAAMQRIDRAGSGMVVVVDDDGRLLGTATDGDIRRGILDGRDTDAPIETVMNDAPIVVDDDWSADEVSAHVASSAIRTRIPAHRTLLAPIVDDDRRVVDLAHLSREGRVLTRKGGGDAVHSVLVIGGAGYIGSVLCRRLLDRGYDVRVLDNLMYGDESIADLYDDERFTLVRGDMRSIESVIEAIKGVDAVVHLGGLVGDPASSLDPQKTLELNYHSVTLAAAICKYHQVNRFVLASTCSVYGKSDTPEDLLSETSPLNPVSLYAQSKIASERALLAMADENFSPTVFRMATIYGLSPRMRFDLVVNVLTAKAATEGVVPIFGGTQYRPLVHVADAARAYVTALEAPITDVAGEVFNVGSNEQNHSIDQIGEIVASCFPAARVDRQADAEDARSYQVAFDKIRDVLGFVPEMTVCDGSLEIKAALEAGLFPDYTDPKYNNFKTLQGSICVDTEIDPSGGTADSGHATVAIPNADDRTTTVTR